jgi:hypothetical protein
MIVFINKGNGALKLYGSYKSLFENETTGITLNHFYNIVAGDFENDKCRILKRDVQRCKQSKNVTQVKNVAPVKTSIEKPKLNILDGTYIKKGSEYFFNLNGRILNESEFLKLGYKRPTKILGNISDLDLKNDVRR